MTSLFAILEGAQEALTELVTGLLMVAGGFLVGYVLGGVVAWSAGRWAFKQKDTQIFQRLGRPIGGVLMALLVAVLVFTGKGKPHGDGGDGKGSSSNDPDAGKNPPAKIEPKLPDLPPVKPNDPKSADAPILITVYGGTRVGGSDRFYRLEAENELRTLASLQEAIATRKSSEKGRLSILIRMPENAAERPGDPRLITQLTEWANSQGLDVTFPATK